MKKSLMLISLAFIFLLTLSVVSAGFWITGDVGQKAGTTTVRETSISGSPDSNKDTTLPGTDSTSSKSFSRARTSSVQKRSSASPGPAWVPVEKVGGGTCYARKEGTTRGFGLFRR